MKKHNTVALFLVGISVGFLLAFTLLKPDHPPVTPQMIRDAAALIGLEFATAEQDSMITQLEADRLAYQTIRGLKLDNSVPPAFIFNPIPAGKVFDMEKKDPLWGLPDHVDVPKNKNDLAFYTVEQLSFLIKNKKVSCLELAGFFLDRMDRYADTLEAVVSLTRLRALEQARKLDAELAAGKYRGPLHGIPYAAKDLFAVEGTKTTWGAMPYKDQVINQTASVICKLDEAGAVLIAKTTLGALAYGDVWFGGTTKNPWDLTQGSSGSSAGSASVTAAGLVPFSIGTETWGSIVSPSSRCGTTGLRPTFGRVSRTGAMALSWTMDKIGPITRSVEDAALVFHAILGPDGQDQTVRDFPFNYDTNREITRLRVGYIQSAFEAEYKNKRNDSLTLVALRQLGIHLIPMELPDDPVYDYSFLLTAEAAAAFDDLTLSDADDKMVRQTSEAWPNLFRSARFNPAVEYINANRARYLLIQKMDSVMQRVDVYVSPSFEGSSLLLTNLTGHPCVVVPNGFDEQMHPSSISFIGQLYDEATLLSVARAYQEATDYHTKHPSMFVE